MMMLQSFFTRITKDFRQKELLPLKLIFFVQASTLYVLYPYLTIHMRELGINVEETAIMSAVTPLVAIVMPPLAGMVADRIGNFRILLSLFSVLGGASALLLLLVPIGRITVTFPDRVVMGLSCPSDAAGLLYTMSQKYPCETKLSPEVETRIESCGYACHVDDPDEKDVENLMTSRRYSVSIFDTETGRNSSFTYNVPKNHISPAVDDKERMKEHRKLSNNNYFSSSIRRVSTNIFFFPSPGLHQFSCAESAIVDVNETTANGVTNRIFENRTLCRFGDLLSADTNAVPASRTYETKLTSLEVTSNDVSEERRRFLAERVSTTGNDFQAIKCTDPKIGSEKVLMVVPLVNYTVGPAPYKTLKMERCSKKCIATAPRKQICSNTNMEVEYNIALTFWLYLVIRVFIGIIGGTTFAMFEGAVIAILREQKADYGLQRIYGSIGGMISSPLSGFLIDYASSDKGYTDFRPAFYLYAALKIVSGVLMLAINLEFKSPATNVVRDVVTVLRNVEMAALFIACFILGTAWGYIESFLFWLIQDLGGSRSLMGITITVGGIAGIPLLVLSGPIISRIGHANVLFIGFIFYAVRLFGYSVIYNPWLTLIFEALESVTSSLSFTAAVTYAAKLSTTTTDSSVQGLLGGVYYGVGKGSGSLIGGYLMKAFGTRPTYQIFAVMSLVTGFLYFFFNVAYLKKRPQVEGNDIVKKKPKKTENQCGLESGVNLKLDEKKEKPSKVENIDSNEKKSINGVVNESYSESDENESANRKKNMEEVNNAKNLDGIEKVSEKSDSKLEEEKSEKENGGPKQNRSNGVANVAFLNETEDSLSKCNVTIEREPENNKK